ncbi:TPA: recombinase family protein [Photobacterium damselae]
MNKYVIYYRVSTKGQGESGLGLEAQQRDIELFLSSQSQPDVIGIFTDIESGTKNDRDQYQQALRLAKKNRAILLVAKLDRLGRRVSEISRVMEELTIKVACMPQADNFQLHIYAALAEQERQFISDRTKSALKAAKERGVKLGRPSKGHQAMVVKATNLRVTKANEFAKLVSPQLLSLRNVGKSFQEIADIQNSLGVRTQRGKEWTPAGVRNVLIRLSEKSLNPN